MEDTTSEQIGVEEGLEETDQDKVAEAQSEDPEDAKEIGRKQRGPLLLKGVSSKKRNVQLLTSPRKRTTTKGGDQGTEGSIPTNHGTVKGATGGASDHSPMITTIADKIPRGKRSFRFDKRWIGKEGLLEAIENGWNSDTELGEGKFVEKLSNCRRAISQWRRDLTPYNLIDTRSNFWNVDLLQAIFDPEDVALISALPVGAPTKEDTLGWHFTKSGKYTVKSGYHATRLDTSGANVSFLGPDITPLKAYSWQVQCPPKIRHFLWQILTGCVPVTENLRKRGVNCDVGCSRCGAPEETINHTLFQCHPARQIWALSQIPTVMGNFPTESIFANMDHLFWRVPSEFDSSAFPWIIWYIWKARNEKIFENVDSDPLEVLRLAENEAQLWQSAQIELINANQGPVDLVTRSRVRTASLEATYSGYRCFVDGSWKGSDQFSGTGWFCTSSSGEPPTMGAANIRRSLSPLHTEVEALLWAMKCMIGADNQEVAFFTDCSDLVKMVSSPTEWPAFSVYLEEFQSDKEEFLSFSLSLISRRANVKADSLARKVRTEPRHITYVNNIPQEWLF
ncbi:Ribonuclease H domain [Arabidopsis thaliana x Arabidopsis arenosa]|uniref:Ribonuclease H domain n=1 Tax=Arabidopsis thaliana x Arabidopsis arenosa TaxID=1240361 RepID=A0A8T2C515_9BRAS|nr:Ribonuclease H domain [Arabidopsis thaliana x Arabidopsis arenosa]